MTRQRGIKSERGKKRCIELKRNQLHSSARNRSTIRLQNAWTEYVGMNHL